MSIAEEYKELALEEETFNRQGSTKQRTDSCRRKLVKRGAAAGGVDMTESTRKMGTRKEERILPFTHLEQAARSELEKKMAEKGCTPRATEATEHPRKIS